MAAGEAPSGSESALPAQIIMLRRLKVALIAAIVVPMLLLIAGSWDERSQLLRAAEGDAIATVTALSEHAVKAIETHELLVRDLDRRVRGMNWDQIKASSAALSAEIRGMHASMPEVSAMALIDAEGRRWAGDGPASRDGSIVLKDREYWYAQRDRDRGTFISEAYVGALSGRPDFAISRRRSTADGRFDGTIHVSVAASYFSDFWAQVVAGRSDAVVALLRLDGRVLARLPATGNVGQPIAQAGAFPMNGQMADQGDGQTGPRERAFRATAASDGVERIYAYSRVGHYPLVIGYGMPVSSVIAPWRQHLLELGVVGVLATAALVLAVLATTRQVHRLIAEQTRRIAIEQAARKGQKLELLGQLTAGIAHDFANILQAMGMAATSLQRRADQPERVRALADRLGEDVERGASLIQRMLDLVRQNRGQANERPGQASGVINPAEAMAGISEMLPRLLGSGYQLRCEVPDPLEAFTAGDRTELEVAIMNLAVNARDAMPDGGDIVIRVDFATVAEGSTEAETDRNRRASAPGRYLRISVIDSGIGMSPEVLAQAGVPFFTTKPHGRGTGLGLAGARGFAERAGGRLSIDSQEGHGTTAMLWLPAVGLSQTADQRSVERVE